MDQFQICDFRFQIEKPPWPHSVFAVSNLKSEICDLK